MNLRKSVLLLVIAMLVLASAADAQRTKSKSKAKKPSNATKTAADSNMPTAPSAASSEQPQAAEHKTEADVPRITVEELKEKLAKNAHIFIIDSRSPGAYEGSERKIKGAVRIPADEVETRLSEIPRDREIVVYCT